MYCLISLLLFDILLLYRYIHLRLSMIFCLSSGDIYISLGISLSSSFVTVSEFFCCKFSETLVIFLPTKSPVVSVFYISLLYYYINLKSPILFCLSFIDMHLSLGISSGIFLSCSFVTFSKLFCCEFSEISLILLAILLLINSPVASAAF